MRNLMLRRSALCAAALLAACSTAPDRNPVPQDAQVVPAAWQTEGLFHEGRPGDTLPKGNWWEAFGDDTLNRLEQQALKQSPNLQIASARLQQARAQVDISASALFPQAALGAGASRSKTSAARAPATYGATVESAVSNNTQFGFSVGYEVDLFGRVRNSVKSARAAAEAAGADFENTRLLLMSDVAAGYFTLRERDAEIDVLEKGIKLQEDALSLVDTRHRLGVASGLDLAQQQTQLDASRTQLELLRNERANYLHALAALVGEAAPSFALAPMPALPSPPSLPPLGLPADVLQRRPDVASAERAVAAANANIGVARAAYFPSLRLEADGGWAAARAAQLFDAPALMWALSAQAAQTLFDAGKTRAGVKIAEESYTGTVAKYRQTVLVALQEVEDGLTGSGYLARAGTQAAANLASAQRVLDLANDRYKGGVATYLDVIVAQQALLNSQRQLAQIRGQQLTTAVFLVKALGGGWDKPALPAE